MDFLSFMDSTYCLNTQDLITLRDGLDILLPKVRLEVYTSNEERILQSSTH